MVEFPCIVTSCDTKWVAMLVPEFTSENASDDNTHTYDLVSRLHTTDSVTHKCK
jgi:hypothetical protein